jgi:aspartyl-tRNA(Asn)/glutamyl-tRNA(Gln) amidotransferase subunit C
MAEPCIPSMAPPYTAIMDPVKALSAGDVNKVARLARLEISDEQAQLYQGQLGGVLSYIERLRELDLTGVEPLTHISGGTNRLDDDVPGPTLPMNALMQMAPDSLPPFVKVPKVIDDGDGA